MRALLWVARLMVLALVMVVAYWLGRYDTISSDMLMGGGIGLAIGFILALAFRKTSPEVATPETPLPILDNTTKGIIAFSFALRASEDEPNPCNIRLAEAVKKIAQAEKSPVVIVTQWEIARKLRADGVPVAHSVELRPDGTYLDSDIVWAEAEQVFGQHGVKEVIPVAQPFMQLTKIRMMLNKSGYKILKRKVGWIGFDKQSSQPWTRGPIRLFIYSVKQLLLGLRGHKGQQSA